jgi:hypothetical protein
MTDTPKLSARLSKGEKRHRKRMAEVGAVYDLKPQPRRPTDVLPAPGHEPHEPHEHDSGPPPQPVAKAANKWVTASVVDDAAEVIAAIVDQAERRDPHHRRPWVALGKHWFFVWGGAWFLGSGRCFRENGLCMVSSPVSRIWSTGIGVGFRVGSSSWSRWTPRFRGTHGWG